MTLAMAWIRKISPHSEELVIASDSRLSGGRRIDCVPKMLSLPRGDSVICFAGDTDFGYPLMLQLSLAMEANFRSRTRGMDIHMLKQHTINVFNDMVDSIHTYANGMEKPETTFIVGGYSWLYKKFDLWSIKYNPKTKAYENHTARAVADFGKVIFAGDMTKQAQGQLMRLLNERRSSPHHRGGFDMEPFEILRDILRKSKPADSVGGPPQLIKVYQHLNCRPLAVYWPNKKSNKVSLLGRPLRDYENTDYFILDPDTLTTSHPKHAPSEDVLEQSYKI